jgi:two-component system NtrC family response regulator
MTKRTLLLVEDDQDIRTQMKWALSQDYEIVVAEDRTGAVAAFKTHAPVLTLLDLGLPPRPNDPGEGLETLAALLALDPRAKVVIVSAGRRVWRL